MTDNSLEERQEIITDLLIDAWDLGRLLTEYEAHYQRGFEAGKAAASLDPEQLKAEYQRGRDDCKRELFAKIDDIRIAVPVTATVDQLNKSAAQQITHDDNHKPIEPVKSIAITKPGRGPKPTDVNRPPGIPSNYEMCRIVLQEVDKPLTGSEIRDHVAQRWWPNIHRDWKACPFGFLSSGKLIKNADNKFTLPAVVVKPNPKPKPEPQAVINREVAKRAEPPRAAVEPFKPRIPAEGRKLGPPARSDVIEFVYGGKTVGLRGREYMVAVKLQAAMGKGHLSVQFLAENALGATRHNAIDNKSLLKDMCTGMSARLRTVGLEVGYFEGFGFIMKELA